MTEQPESAQVACSACGSECLATSKSCWLCHADLANSQPIITASVVLEHPTKSTADPILTGLTIACVCFALLIGIGIVQSDPGMLIPYLIFVTPAFIATGGRAAWARLSGKQLSGSQLFLTFMGSMAMIVGLFGMLIVGGIVALFLACLSMATNDFR